MFFNEPLKNVVKSHIKTNCLKEFCLSCELGFIVRMLEDAKGSNCQASNFLRAFGTIPQGIYVYIYDICILYYIYCQKKKYIYIYMYYIYILIF